MKNKNIEIKKQESDNGLAKFIGGIVFASAVILPISGCIEGHSGYGIYYPRDYYNRHQYYGPPIVMPPLMPHSRPQFYRDFRPMIQPPNRNYHHFNNGPYRNYPGPQKSQRR